VDLDLRGVSPQDVSARVLAPSSVRSFNSAADPDQVSPRPLEVVETSTGVRLTLPAHSFAVVEVR
jgi:alpha-L-arabinofuranosidase